jgi:hypothetical protein
MKHKVGTQTQPEQYFPKPGNSPEKIFSAQTKGQPFLLLIKMMQNDFCANH